MRDAKAQDCWRRILRRGFTYHLKNIDLCGHFGINQVTIVPGIFALCGLNGAGKTTIFTAIKDVLGVPLTAHEIKRCADLSATAVFNADNRDDIELNNSTLRLSALHPEINVTVIDHAVAGNTLKFFSNQENINEFFEAEEIAEFDAKELESISQIVGKHYNKIEFYEIYEINDDESSAPFFFVTEGGLQYDSLAMGLGEHFLLYSFWSLKRAEKNSILLFEEPETHISIRSQRELIDYLAYQSTENGLSTILSTHSPFILDKIPPKNVYHISRLCGDSTLIIGGTEESYARALKLLGLPPSKDIVIFVEDEVAQYQLQSILKHYRPHYVDRCIIDMLPGESLIKCFLESAPSSLNNNLIIGAFDHDCLSKIDSGTFQRPHVFLPGTTQSFEKELIGLFLKEDTLRKYSDRKNISFPDLYAKVSALLGEDHHDWIDEFRRALVVSKEELVEDLTFLWTECNVEETTNFLDSLDAVLEGHKNKP